MKSNNGHQKTAFSITMQDGSIFEVPNEWNDAFYIKYGTNPEKLKEVEEIVLYASNKYYEHRAWPSKFDGIVYADDLEGYDADSLSRYDYDGYYMEKWDEQRPGSISKSYIPTMSEIAKEVMYHNLRVLLMRQALKDMGSDVQVITLEDLESNRHLPES